MSIGSPRLVATLPARSVGDARTQAEEARRAGADIAEIRFDRWPTSHRDRAGELFPPPLPLMATLRSHAEGGEGPDDPTERTAILRNLVRHPFAWIDLELARDDATRILADAPTAPAVVRSTHYPEGTPTGTVLEALGTPVPAGSIQKLVVPATSTVVVNEYIPALRKLPRSHARVLLTTGGSGPLLRALAKVLDLPMVYGSLPQALRSTGPVPVEPAQVPIDRLRRLFSSPDDPPLFALVGHPVAHSLSPTIHDRWYTAMGQTGLYVPLDVGSEEEFRTLLDTLGALGFRGINVTHPWKSVALAAARTASRSATECGAANCLTLVRDRWEADNTDFLAMKRRLEELRSGGTWDGHHLTVLGAGGTARATLAAARALGIPTRVVARRREAAEEVARTFGSEAGDPSHPLPSSLVVHATSAGQEVGRELTFPVDGLVSTGSTILDWVYRPADRHLARAAEKAGARYESGERLLVYQAISSFANWWGTPPPPDAVCAVLEEVGCAA